MDVTSSFATIHQDSAESRYQAYSWSMKITVARLERLKGFYQNAINNLQARLDSPADTPSSKRKVQQELLRAQESLNSAERQLAELRAKQQI